MRCSDLRYLVRFRTVLTVSALAVGTIVGCGGGTPTGMPEKASTSQLEAAKESLAAKTNVKKGKKALDEDSNLSAKERRILAKEGLLPKSDK